MHLFKQHHLHYHVLTVLLIVWAIVFKLDLFQASALGDFTLAQPTVTCSNGIPNVSLEWSVSEHSDTYSVERALGDVTSNLGFNGPIMSQLKTTKYVDDRFQSNYGRMPYSYRVTAYSGNTQVYSNTVAVELPECSDTPIDPFADIATSTQQMYGSRYGTAEGADLALPVNNDIEAATLNTASVTKRVVKKAATTKTTQTAATTVAPAVQTATTLAAKSVTSTNMVPIAWLELPYFATSSVNQGTSISFMGSGDDDGPIAGYEWRLENCTTGTVISTEAQFTKFDFPIGTTTVYFRVKDSTGTWSTNCQRRAIIVKSLTPGAVVTVPTTPVPVVTPPANKIPTASISAPSAVTTSIATGVNITLVGAGADTDGSIVGYEWREANCTTGTVLATTASFSKSNFIAGTHQVFLRVRDNTGAWSTNCPTKTVVVIAPVAVPTTTPVANKIPTASIPAPSAVSTSITAGGNMTFTGTGTDSDGTITSYEWRDNNCTTGALLSTASTFSKTDFSVGTHQVYLRVKDNTGAWSTNCPVKTVILTAVAAPAPVANKLPTVTVSAPAAATTNIAFNTPITLTGQATDSDGTISGYEWREGNCTTGPLHSTAASFSKADFTTGTHTMFFRAKDNTGAWSASCVSKVVVVAAAVAAVATATIPTNKIPTATIIAPTILSTSITSGGNITFTGSGTDTDGTIAGYEWRDGNCTTGTLLSTSASFSKADFSVGTHQVYFRVKDNKGDWSTTCQTRSVITAAPVVVVPPVAVPTSPTQSTPAVAGKIPSWMKWGAFVGWQDTAMSSFESLVGKQPQLEAAFTHWGNDQFPSFYGPRVRDKGRTLVIFWEAVDYNRDYFSQPEYSFDSVIAGKMDAYFTKFAADAKAYGGEIILVPYSEFNSDWFPWGLTIGNNSPEKFKQAWIHIHDIFADAPNVKFGWVPNNDSIPDIASNNFDLAYPGSAYVDVVGIDGFDDTPWETFDTMVGGELTRLKKYAKPIYIMSMGVKEDARKAAWITDMATQLYKYPEVKGFIWFNENKERDWRVNSSAAALSAFKAILP